MLDTLNSLPWPVASVICMAVFSLIVLLGLWLTRKLVLSSTLKAHHDVAACTFGIIGMIYAVLLGFMVVEVNGNFHDAQRHILQETAILADLFRDAATFEKESRRNLRILIRDYTAAVCHNELVTTKEGEDCLQAISSFQALWHAYAHLPIKNRKQEIWYRISLEKLNKLSDERTYRLFTTGSSVGGLMWTVLIIGALVTTGFMCFFAMESTRLQTTMSTLLAATIAIMLFLILSLQGIYSGDVHISTQDMEKSLQDFNATIDKESKEPVTS